MLKSEWSFVRKIIPIVGLTLAFEITQFIFAIGRADITDVLGNMLGGLIGVGIYALMSKVLKNRTNTVINVLAAAFTTCALLFIAFLMLTKHWIRIK